MGDQIVTPFDFNFAAFRTALARARRRVRRWITRQRPRKSPADLTDLSDWILRDIGVVRERDMGTGFEVDPREAARQFWHP